MNAKNLILISGLALAGAMFLGCEDRTDDSTAVPPADTTTDTRPATAPSGARDTTYASPAGGAYTDERRDAFAESAQEQYDALEEELAAIAAEAEAKGEVVVARFNEIRPTLEAQLQVLEQRLDSVKGATAATWTQLESAYTEMVNDVRTSFAQARQTLLGAPAPQPTNPPANRPTTPPTNPPANPPSNPPAPPG